MTGKIEWACIKQLKNAGAFAGKNFSLGFNVGMSAAHEAYSSTSLAGLSVGVSGGGSLGGPGAVFGFDLGISWSVNLPPKKTGGDLGGLIGPTYEWPSFQLAAAFGSVNANVRLTLSIAYSWQINGG